MTTPLAKNDTAAAVAVAAVVIQVQTGGVGHRPAETAGPEVLTPAVARPSGPAAVRGSPAVASQLVGPEVGKSGENGRGEDGRRHLHPVGAVAPPAVRQGTAVPTRTKLPRCRPQNRHYRGEFLRPLREFLRPPQQVCPLL